VRRAAILALTAALATLAACSPQPRAISYFKAHPEEAGKVIVDCAAGAHRGAECVNAQAAADQVRSDARLTLYKTSF
jgi:hypothetical protein